MYLIENNKIVIYNKTAFDLINYYFTWTLQIIRIETIGNAVTQMKIDEVSAQIESREVSVIADQTFRKLFVLLHLSLARLRDRRPATLRRLRPSDEMSASTRNRGRPRSGQNLRIDEAHVDVERLGRKLADLLNDG